jgi:hypothetical protein
MHKPAEQGGCSHGGENKGEDSFHRFDARWVFITVGVIA